MANEIDLDDYDFTDLHNYPNIGVDKDGNIIELSFNGNVLLRPFNSKLFLTEEAEAEIEKCRNDKFYFWENYCKIQTIDQGVINIKFREYQKEFLQLIDDNKLIVGLLARQIGKTTAVTLYALWCLIFKKDFTVGIVANKSDLVIEIVSKIKDMYELLPSFLQEGVKIWNARTIKLSNGNRVLSAVAGGSALRGRTINLLIIDEHAFIDGNKIKPFNDSVMPALSSGLNTKIVIISTPNGYNHYHKLYTEAEKGLNGYVYYFADWRAVPGRDEEWKRKEIAKTSFVEFQQNHGCSFIGSSSTLLSPEGLGKLVKQKPLVEDFMYPGFRLYKEYDYNKRYALSLDSSKTVGKADAENDYNCIKILEYGSKIEEVASYRTNSLHYSELANIIYTVGEAFDFPLCIVENNEGSGQSTVDKLNETFEYPNIYFDPNHDGLIAGVRTTSKRKSVGLSNIKKLVDNNILIINDKDTIDEFFTFIKVGKSYQAQAGATDDCIMSLNTNLLILLDESNELELTIDDYLDGDIKLKEIEEESENDTDFIGHIGNGISSEDKSWLYG